MNNRRKLLVALAAGAVVTPLGSFAQQQPAKIARIGFLGPTSAVGIADRLEAFRAGMRDLGYGEGKNIIIEFRWADGNYDRLPKLAAELVRLKVDLIVTYGGPGIRAARQATSTIPIVMASTGDPVAAGHVGSLARPGGNVTGLSVIGREINAKRLELLKEAFPRVRRLAALFNPGVAGALPTMEAAAGSLKVELLQFGVRSPDEFESAFAVMSKKHVEAVAILDDPMLLANATAVASLAAKYRVPSIGFIEVAEAGGLMAYGVNTPAMFRRSAVFVDKILKGANPGDIPIERATKFELVVNQKTAKALGLTIPQPFLMRADRVIE